MSQYVVTIYAQHGITVIPVYRVVYFSATIVDAHLSGERLIERFNVHRPPGTFFFVLVSDVESVCR